MQSAFRAIVLWLVLAGLSCLLVKAAHEESFQSLASGSLIVLPALAVWLTARAFSALSERRLWRIGFSVVTAAGWVALLTLIQGRAEAHVTGRPIVLRPARRIDNRA